MTLDVGLDVKDRKILSELDMDARQPLSSIAKRVGLSREVVHYRIKQLEGSDVIQGYFTVFDPAKLGLVYCKLFFKYRKMGPEKEAELLSFCNEHPNITWIIRGEGKWDIYLAILADTLGTIESVYNELNSRFGLYFQNPYLSIAFKIHEFKHKYLYAKPEHQEYVLGGEGKKASWDSTDYAIMELLSRNARLPLAEIAKSLKNSPKMVRYRIKKLLEDKTILAFRARINAKLLGYDYYKVFLTLQSFDQKNQSKIIAFLRYHPNVIYVTKPIGTHTLEFETRVRNATELHELMRQFKSEFGDILIDYDLYFTYDARSFGYFPKRRGHAGS